MGNPRRKRRRARRRTLLFNDPGKKRRRVKRTSTKARRRRRRAAGPKRSWLRRLFRRNPVRRRRSRRAYRYNPVRRRRRRGGRGAGVSSLPAISFRRPLSLLIPVVAGTAGYIASDLAPIKLGMVTDFPRLGVKAAVVFGGSMIVGRFDGRANGYAWALGSGINFFQDILRTFIFKTGLPAAGFGASPREFGAFPSGGYQVRERVHNRITPY